MTTLTVKVLEVTAKTPANSPEESDKFFTFKAFEYPNGVVSVSYETTNDAFFTDRDEIVGCGNDEIESVEETGKTFEMSIASFRESVEASIDEFGRCDATQKAMELIPQEERKFVSNSETYEVFCGGVTPQGFVEGYESVESAINDLLENWSYDEPIPSWLSSALTEYIEGVLNDA